MPPFLKTIAIPIVLGVLLLWGVRWTIREETEKTREAMKEAGETVVLDNIRSTIDTLKNEGAELSSQAIESMERIIQPRPDAENSPSSGSARPSDSSIIGELFRTGQQVTREVDNVVQDSVKLTSAEEFELGRELYQSIIRSEKVIQDDGLNRMLTRLSQPFLAKRSGTALPIKFTVIDSDKVNAFAHFGGFVYVNRGLLDFLNGDAELAFVLGHEIAHVELGHCSRQAKIITLASDLGVDSITPLAQMAYNAVAVGYSEDMELEADAWAYQAMSTGRAAALKFLERLDRLELQSSPTLSSDPLSVVLSQLDDHFATHPKTRRRIDTLLSLETE